MQKQKLVYEVPQTDALVVRFEESILNAVSPGQNEEIPDSTPFGGKNGWE